MGGIQQTPYEANDVTVQRIFPSKQKLREAELAREDDSEFARSRGSRHPSGWEGTASGRAPSKLPTMYVRLLAALFKSLAAAPLFREIGFHEKLSYRMTRSSPTRLVTRSRSRYSSKGMAYLRLTPVSSLKLATLILGFLVF